jgi:hypothetical protein
MKSPPDPIPRVSARKYRGLGDVVEALAQPIARAIDRVAGTHLATCSGCAARKAKLNRLLPL